MNSKESEKRKYEHFRHGSEKGYQSGISKRVKTSSTSIVDKSESELRFARRPGYGTIGEKVALIVNYFRARLSEINIYHYDVTIEKVVKSSTLKESSSSKLKQVRLASENHAIVKYLVENSCKFGETFRDILPVFDGQKNLFTSKRLNIDDSGRTFQVVSPEYGREVEHQVKLKFARKVDYNPRKSTEVSDDFIHILEIILNYGSRFAKQPKLIIRSAIIDLSLKCIPLKDNKSLGFGCTTAIKNTKTGLVLNIDRKVSVINNGGPLQDIIEQILGIRISSETRFNENDRKIVEKCLKNLKLVVIHLPYRRKYTFQRLSERNISQITFESEGKVISIKDYFYSKYIDALKKKNIRLRSNLPCVYVTSKSYLPIEVCEILPNQPHVGKVSDDILNEITRSTARIRIEERFKTIEASRSSLLADSRDYLKEFGIEIDSKLISVTGRKLPLPHLEHKDSRGKPCVFYPSNLGSWNMWNPTKQFFHAASLQKWLIVSFVNDVDQNTIINFVKKFIEIARDYGININYPREKPLFFTYANLRGKISQFFQKCLQKYYDIQLIMFIIDKEYGLYEEIKHTGDVLFGIPTQCISSKNFLSDKRRGNGRPMVFDNSYLRNLFQKINGKLGGINTVLDATKKPEYLRMSTMVVGIDVSHPSPVDKLSHSLAACVASSDDQHTKYFAHIKVQEPFVKVNVLNKEKDKLVEEIVKLDEVMEKLLHVYLEKNKELPENIIIYRDGVSDGQLQHVFIHELKTLRACFEKFNSYKPKLTVVIVQKRHHTRFIPDFCEGQRNTHRSGNVMPGTCVDDKCEFRKFRERMVRIKRRYVLIEICVNDSRFDTRQDLPFGEKQVIAAIRSKIHEIHGDFGLGSVLMSLNCKKFDKITKIVIISCRRDPIQALLTSLPLVTRIGDVFCTLNSLKLTGTLRSCLKSLALYYKRENNKMKIS
ncbi:protein argonaute-4-like protein [Dinothrombium tinctorium]|uniref:Protein argonaute-4-like protein n=1 Tax=Dinothrombium tinctorium TaxID=1965070 RepID=A0A3S3P836_9ACAR|nr:protein argonaute-4-like protein [Dinothrombium tinctorium]